MEAKAEISTSFDRELCSKIESLEEEKCALKDQLATLAGDLQMRTLELELSISTAEAASKQHLDNIKRVTKLEAECCQLRADARKSSLAHEQKLISNSHYAESVTDSQSDAGEEFLSLDNEQTNARHVTTSMEIHLMDDFLKMEKLVALPEIADHGSSSIEHGDDLDHTSTGESSSRKELESIRLHMTELEEMVEKIVFKFHGI
ncbi:filament-like plant protein 3 isoform X2 [Canna indica]|uniref:Filament-like plant protein 3 isoform X2 n=1 Tax=Canna indica TaxID=4628 RepID=A0AAQ3JQ49_9LILI|nr:filament-like plant protein 3 isoform X2 [Canna indica]